jgi:hypothetical protein
MAYKKKDPLKANKRMFSIDIKVNGEIIYRIEGQNLSPREYNYAGPCVYGLKCNDFEFSTVHTRKLGLLRLCSRSISRLCRLVEKKKVTKEVLEYGYEPKEELIKNENIINKH